MMIIIFLIVKMPTRFATSALFLLETNELILIKFILYSSSLVSVIQYGFIFLQVSGVS